MRKIDYPNQLWKKLMLLSPFPLDSMPDLLMFRRAFLANKNLVEKQNIQREFEKAIQEWDDLQIKEFLCSYIFDPPATFEIENMGPEKRRYVLKEIYHDICT